MNRRAPLDRVRRGAVFLAVVFVTALVGYKVVVECSWPEALWMVVVTISGVGYSEKPESETPVLMFTVAVILFGMTAAAYTFGGFIQMVMEGELDRVMGHHRTAKEVDKLSNHVVLCGFGRIGRVLADDLHARGKKFVVIEHEPEMLAELANRGYLHIPGDATDDDSLIAAGITRAGTLVSALPQDTTNVFITLSARNLNKDIQIIARADQVASEKKMRQAGANKIVMPKIIGAQQMSRMITRPYIADMMELVAESSVLDVEMDELLVKESCGLADVSVRDADINRCYGLLVIAVKNGEGDMKFSPGSKYVFSVGDVVIVMGPVDKIKRFRNDYFA